MSRIAQVLWLASSLLCSNLFAQTEIRWAPDLDTARRAAAQFQVPLLVHFYGDNCLPCKTLEQRVYSQDAVVKTLNKYFICVRINASQDRALAADFQVHSWPTDIFVSPDGQTLYQGVSKQDIGTYMEVLQNVAVMNKDRNSLIAAERAKQTSATGQLAGNQQPSQPTANAGMLPASQSHSMSAPPSIAASVPASQTQIAPPSRPAMMESGAGLPPLPTQLASRPLGSDGLGSQNISAQMNSQPNMPFVAENKNIAPKSQFGSIPSSLVSNPHYVDSQGYDESEPMVCTPDGKCGPASVMNKVAGANDAPIHFASSATSITTPNATGTQSNDTAPASPTFQPRSATPVSNPTLQTQPTTEPSEPGPGLIETPSEPAAYSGYCPIALVTTGQKVKGSSEYAVRHRGRTYLMQNADAVKLFMQSPDRFSPILSGYDPMVFLESGQFVEGALEHALHDPSSGTVILFATAESQKRFKADPARNARALSYIMSAATKK